MGVLLLPVRWAAVLLAVVHPISGFVLAERAAPIRNSPSALGYRNLPSVDDVSSDEFTEQVYHGSSLVKELSASLVYGAADSSAKAGETKPLLFFAEEEVPESATELPSSSVDSASIPTTGQENLERMKDIANSQHQLEELLTAQLSHQDGIRGFFVAYLTGEGDTTADMEQVPALLQDAMKQSNLEHLTYSLCMNLIVPTAMIYVHDKEYTASTMTKSSSSSSVYKSPLAQNSAIVATRTKRIMSTLKGSINMVKNWEAIIVAANKNSTTQLPFETPQSSKLVQFWEGVFDLCDYSIEQKQRIVDEFMDITSPAV